MKNYWNKALLAFGLLFFSISSFADKVSKNEAWSKAQPYLKEQTTMSRSLVRGQSSTTDDDSQPLYIFSRGENQGFVIVAGDDCLPAIIGTTESGNYDEENMPPAMKAIIEHYANAVAEAQAAGTNSKYASLTGSTYDEDIEPLLTSHWHQNGPWNNLCPQRSDGGGRAVTGCVATAASQIAYYWRNDGLNAVSQYDTPTYSYGDAPVTSVIVKKGTAFNWELMADRSTTTAGNAAMARLCVLMGTCSYLTYGSSTGGYIYNTQDVFQNQIGMTRGVYLQKNNYSQSAWEKLVISDLVQGRPILYSSYNKEVEGWDGHAYVVDGYRTSDNTYHINFGWGDGHDAYFTMAETSRSAMGSRPDDQQMVYQLYSQNMDRTITAEIVGGSLYQALENKIAFSIENNSSVSVKGMYLFASSSASLPSGTTLEDALGSYSETISKGEAVTDTAIYTNLYVDSKGVYFIVTDENLSVLYTTENAAPILASRGSVRLNSLSVDNSGSEEKTFKYQGEEVTRTVYTVESGSGVALSANISNDIPSGRFKSTYCQPVITADIYKVEEDGTCTIVQSYAKRDSTFEVNDVKDMPYEFYNLEANVLYKASIYGKVGNGIGTLMLALNYNTERADTMVFFKLTGSDMNVKREGSFVTISGSTFDKIVYNGLMSDATVTSYDMKNFTPNYPETVASPANPNAIIYATSDMPLNNNVVVDGTCANLVLQQGYDYSPAYDFKATQATLKIEGDVCSNSDYFWNTVMLPFSAPTPYGMLARYFVDESKYTIVSVDTIQAGTPHVYLMTHDINEITAQNVDVYALSSMPESIGYDACVGIFSNMVTDGTQALCTGKEFTMAESGVEIPSFTAYRTNEISLTYMHTTRGVENGMHLLVPTIVGARETLEEYRDDRSEDAIATFESAIADAEKLLTLLPAVFNDINNGRLALVEAQKVYVNATGIETVSSENSTNKKSDIIYDLSGRRLSGIPDKGVYIINGKKYVK